MNPGGLNNVFVVFKAKNASGRSGEFNLNWLHFSEK